MGFDCDTYQSSIVCIWKKNTKANTVRETYFFKSSKSNLCLWEDTVSAKVLGLWLKDVCSLIRFVGRWIGFRISGRKENRLKTAEHKDCNNEKMKTMRKKMKRLKPNCSLKYGT